MKIVVVSDTHGRHGGLEQVIEKEKPFDALVHLGDVEGGEDYIKALVDCEIKMIGGNNDYYSNLPGEAEFIMGGKRFFIAHGHTYFVGYGSERIAKEGVRRKCDMVMFGHIHKPVVEKKLGVLILCPGSIAYPRQRDRKCSYGIVNIESNGTLNYEIQYI